MPTLGLQDDYETRTSGCVVAVFDNTVLLPVESPWRATYLRCLGKSYSLGEKPAGFLLPIPLFLCFFLERRHLYCATCDHYGLFFPIYSKPHLDYCSRVRAEHKIGSHTTIRWLVVALNYFLNPLIFPNHLAIIFSADNSPSPPAPGSMHVAYPPTSVAKLLSLRSGHPISSAAPNKQQKRGLSSSVTV